MNNLFLGIDLGTSAVKVLLSDESGKPIKESKKTYKVSSPFPLWNEQNPEDWWNSTVLAVKEATNGINPNNIKALSFSGQMHGLVTLDENNNVIRPCILWNDGRSFEQVKYLNNVIGEETLIKETGNIAFPGFTLPKLMWMKENEPELFNKISKIMLPKDYLIYKMTGKFATDYSDASGTLMLDVKNKTWSEYICKLADIRGEQLPVIYKSYEVVGTLTREAAFIMNLPFEVKVVAGGADNAVAAVANGCVEKGDASISLGTSGTILVIKDQYEQTKNSSIHNFLSCNDNYYHMGCVLNGSSSREWWIERVLDGDYAEDDKLIANLETNVIFLPYLNGERCPYNNPELKGAFLNLSSTTTRAEMSKAVLESSMFSIADAFEALDDHSLEKIMVSGGGSRNPYVKVGLASLLDVDIVSTNSEYGPAVGACLLAIRGYNNAESFIKLKRENSKLYKKDLNIKEYLQRKIRDYRKFALLIK